MKCPNKCGTNLVKLTDGSGSLFCLKCRKAFKHTITPEEPKTRGSSLKEILTFKNLRTLAKDAKETWDKV